MNRETMQGNWNQIKADVQTKWGKLTHDDVELAKGKFETLVASLQQRYGLAKDRAEADLDAFIETIDLSKLSKETEVAANAKANAPVATASEKPATPIVNVASEKPAPSIEAKA
jgi:uncharacterized protein YjbJ (UPF0337 family)